MLKIADDTIAAIATPVGEGGIAIVRLSGADSLKILNSLFISRNGSNPPDFKTHTVHYGHVVVKIPASEIIDEVIVTIMKAPRSYTREDVVEINCHGGIQAAKRVLELLTALGARIAEPGEFTKRAFLNGRIDLAQAEAVLDIIRSKTEGSLKVALNQLEGVLSKEIDSIRSDIVEMASSIEASIDFPEEDTDSIEEKRLADKSGSIISHLKDMIDTYDDGVVLREGVLAIICGKPNVGKSSLMNLLLKRDRVIVSPIPGTTRDAVEEFINLKGIPIRLVDTAGITRTDNPLDGEGVKHSKKYLKAADIALLVLDGSTPIEKADLDIMKLVGKKKRIIVINKIDRVKKIDADSLKRLSGDDRVVRISVKRRKNISSLEKALSEMVYSGSFEQAEAAVVTNARHKALLDKAYRCMLSVKESISRREGPELVSIDLKEAIFSLGLVTGKSVSDDVLNRIFEKFCIGK